jgi:hypothetical protein
MKFNASCKISAACAKSVGRYEMGSAHLDVEQGKIFATDGRILAVIPVSEIGEDESSGPISRAALDAAIKLPTGAVEAEIVANGSITVRSRDGELVMPRSAVDEVCRPRYEAIMEPVADDDLVVGLNPKLLLALCQAIGAVDHVELRFRKDRGWCASGYTNPVHLRANGTDGAEGWIMPISIG